MQISTPVPQLSEVANAPVQGCVVKLDTEVQIVDVLHGLCHVVRVRSLF